MVNGSQQLLPSLLSKVMMKYKLSIISRGRGKKWLHVSCLLFFVCSPEEKNLWPKSLGLRVSQSHFLHHTKSVGREIERKREREREREKNGNVGAKKEGHVDLLLLFLFFLLRSVQTVSGKNKKLLSKCIGYAFGKLRKRKSLGTFDRRP